MELLKKDGAYAICPFSKNPCNTSCPMVLTSPHRDIEGRALYFCGLIEKDRLSVMGSGNMVRSCDD